MKKLLSLCLCLVLVGCSSNTISQEEYDALVKKNEGLTEEVIKLNKEIKDLNNQDNSVDVKISGGFVATVRDKIPDYVLDDFTLNTVILQWFQGDMFVMKIDEKMISNLEIGKTYYFEIEEVILDKESYGLTVSETQKLLNGNISSYNFIKIKSYRNPIDNEGGLESYFVIIEEVK